MVLHAISLAARYPDHIIAMKDGAIMAQGTPAEVITPARLLEVFGLDAHVVHEPTEGRPSRHPPRDRRGRCGFGAVLRNS